MNQPGALTRQRGAVSLALCLCAALLLAACGKKGNPLPPLVRIPAPPADIAATRLADDVYVRFVAPSRNIDGEAPADVARVEVYAVTVEGPASKLAALAPEELREIATLIDTIDVRRPLPPPPPPEEGLPPVPLPPPAPGVDQGSVVVVHERIGPEVQVPVEVPDEREVTTDIEETIEVPRPLVAPPSASGAERHYFAVGVSPRGP